MMSKAMQVKITKQEMQDAIQKFLNKKIIEIFKKQKINQQIAAEIDQTVIEIGSADYDARIKALEEKVYGKDIRRQDNTVQHNVRRKKNA